MMEKDSLAVERLKLLSNTAMLKKVLDKKDPPKLREFGTTGETRRDSCAEDPAPPMELSSDSIRSPRTSRIENSHRAETPSSHPTGDTTRDSPPVSRDAAGITPIMSHHQQYLRTTDGEHFRSSGGASTLPLVPTMSRRDYTAGVQGESYYPQRNNTLTGMAVVAHGLYPGPGRPNRPYSVKENVPPCAFQNPYGERRLAETPHYRSMNEGSVLFYPPQVASVSEDREDASPMISYEGLTRANYHMHDKLKEKDAIISSLQQRVNYLEKQISELRQLPTGKISHIPIDDMIKIMQEYGSEVSNQTLPKRRENIKKASIVRQFRRWNPEFFRYFIHMNGEWVPKLGREAELERRAEKRRQLKRKSAKDQLEK